MAYRLGVDVGGTFTDVLLINEDTGDTWREKVQSTPIDSSLGVLQGIDRVCATANINPTSISQIMHGTTVATNAILQGKGAKIGLVTTQGYRQMLQIGRSFGCGYLVVGQSGSAAFGRGKNQDVVGLKGSLYLAPHKLPQLLDLVVSLSWHDGPGQQPDLIGMSELVELVSDPVARYKDARHEGTANL